MHAGSAFPDRCVATYIGTQGDAVPRHAESRLTVLSCNIICCFPNDALCRLAPTTLASSMGSYCERHETSVTQRA